MAKESPDDLYEDDKWDFNDDGFGGMDNFGMEDDSEDDDRKPKGKFTSSVTRSLKHVGKETAKGVAAGIAKGVSDGMPNVKSTYDLTTEAMSELSRLKYDVLDQARPIINQTKKATKELLRQAKGVIPFGIDQKIIDFIDRHSEPEEDKREISIQEQRDNNLSEMLGNIFKLQTEKAIETQKRAVVDRVIDEQLAKSRHAESVGFLGDIKSAIFYQSAFTKSVFTSYLKKDLELKLRHLYVAQDQLNVLNVTARMLEQRLTAIAKNTSLPDSQKITATETAKKMMRESFLSNTGKKAQELFSTMVTNIKDEYVSPLLSQFEMMNMATESVAQLFEAMNEADETSFGENSVKWNSKLGLAGSGTGFLGGILGTKLFRKIFNAINPKSRKMIEQYLSHGKSGLMAMLQKMSEGDAWYSQHLSTILPNLNDDFRLKNAEFTNLTEGSKLTNRTVETIERIIPGFLSLQTKFLEMIATQRTDVKELAWDFAKQEFVTKDSKVQEFERNAFGTKEEKISRLKASADRTVEIISLYGDKRYKKQLLVNHRVIADDFEKFKLGLATSGKYLIIDESFWETCKQIASGKAFADKSIKSTDLWQYGFSRCKNPDVVAHFLVTLLTTKGGLFNKGVAWELQHDIVDTGDNLLSSFKNTILEAERVGDTTLLNKYGKRNSWGELEIDRAKYADTYLSDDITVAGQLKEEDGKERDRWGNYSSINQKKMGEKIVDNIVSSFKDGSTGLVADIKEWTKDAAMSVLETIYNYTAGLGKTDKQKQSGFAKVRKKIDKFVNKGKEKASKLFEAGSEFLSDKLDAGSTLIHDFLNDIEKTKPLADLLFVKTGRGKKARYVFKKEITGFELAKFFGDKDNSTANDALQFIKEHANHPLINAFIENSEALQILLQLTEDHETVIINKKGKEEVVKQSAIAEILSIRNLKEREAKIEEIVAKHKQMGLIDPLSGNLSRAVSKANKQRSAALEKIRTGEAKKAKAEKPSETSTMLKVLENSYTELQYMRSYLFDIAAVKVTETSRSMDELRRGYESSNPFHEKLRNEEAAKKRKQEEIAKAQQKWKEAPFQYTVGENGEITNQPDELAAALQRNTNYNSPLAQLNGTDASFVTDEKTGFKYRAVTKNASNIINRDKVNQRNVDAYRAEQEQYEAEKKRIENVLRVRTGDRRRLVLSNREFVDEKGHTFKLSKADVDEMIKADEIRIKEELAQLEENHKLAVKQFEKNEVTSDKDIFRYSETMYDAGFDNRRFLYEADKNGNIKLKSGKDGFDFALSDEGKFYLGSGKEKGYLNELREATESYKDRRDLILSAIKLIYKLTQQTDVETKKPKVNWPDNLVKACKAYISLEDQDGHSQIA